MAQTDQFTIDVSDLLKERGAERRLTLEGNIPELLEGEVVITLDSPIELDLTLTNVEDKILAKGTLETRAKLDCSRCLKEFGYPVHASFSELFVKPSAFEEVGYEDAEDRMALSIEDDKIDLTSLAEQTVLLSLPMKPLCTEVCKGLCPVCGKDLNIEPHTHEDEKTDPRLAPLKKLLKEH